MVEPASSTAVGWHWKPVGGDWLGRSPAATGRPVAASQSTQWPATSQLSRRVAETRSREISAAWPRSRRTAARTVAVKTAGERPLTAAESV
jgi:hypothetical protein